MPKIFKIVRPGVAEVKEVVEFSNDTEDFPRANGYEAVDEDNFRRAVSFNTENLHHEKELEWFVQENESVSESQEVDETNPLICKICHINLENRVYLEAHLHNVHGQTLAEDSVLSQLAVTDDAPKISQSAYPDEEFVDSQLLQDGTHSLQRKFPNPVVERAHKCEICSRSFSRRGTLTRHMKTHSDDRPHKCHICRKVFGFRASLMHHLAIHGPSGGDKLHKCNDCGKSFAEKPLYNKHIKTECWKYKCRYCQRPFNKMQGLSRHISQCHTAQLDEEYMLCETQEAAKRFKCEYCGKSYCHKKDMRRHHMAKHPNLEWKP